MKKILLTLFAVAAIFVACDKDAYDQEITNINVLEQAEEINASVESSVDIDALTATLNRLSNNRKNYQPKPSNDTAKTGGAGAYIAIVGGVNSGSFYEFLFSNDLAPCNLDDYSYLETVYLVLNAANETEIRLLAPSGSPTESLLVGTITDDFSFLYTITISEGLKVVLSSSVIDHQPDSSASLSFAFGSDTFDFSCGVDLTGAYDVMPAPFPLTGFLARINSDFDFTGLDANALNYAGSSREDVVREIENDIMN